MGSRSNSYEVIEFESYKEALDMMKEVDESAVPKVSEYREILELYPTSLELRTEKGQKPAYRLHFVPGDRESAKMLTEQQNSVENILEGRTTFGKMREVKGELA